MPEPLLCWVLDVSRDVVETVRRSLGSVRAELSYRERTSSTATRGCASSPRWGALETPLRRLGCGGCPSWRPVGVVVGDLDGGEPAVILDAFTGGAHCCTYSEIFRFDRACGSHRRT